MNQDRKPNSPLTLKPEQEIGQYRLVSKLGAGGMGDVWRAHDETLQRDVALKFPSRDAYAGTKAYDQMLAEARTVAALNHPNVVTVHEVGEHSGQPFIAMAYIEGQTLQQLMARQKVSLKMTLALGIQIADALAAAHARSLTHRDLKPGNVMIDKALGCHVVDFGLAVSFAQATEDEDKTVDAEPAKPVKAGTISYMAPEQISTDRATHQVDIFALGIILFEMTFGTHPLKSVSRSDYFRSLLSDAPIPMPESSDEIPNDLTRIIRRCLEKDPEFRFQTAKDVRNELRDLQRALEAGTAFSTMSHPGYDPGRVAMQEHRFPITAELVRQLEFQSPKMIGDAIAYLDNGHFSDTLVIYVHAWGLDFRQCVDYLQSLPFRGIAPTLYGFGEHAKNRLPLTMSDHSFLLRQLFCQLHDRLQPERVILVGHSSGADHLLHMGTSEDGIGIRTDGLLLLGCNISLSTCFISEKFANLEHSSAAGLLEEIKQIGNSAKSLGEWLKMHEYLVTVFSKFGENADPLRAYGADIVAPFVAHDWRQFAAWCRDATAQYDHVRFVFDPDEFEAVEQILLEHLKDNVLGDHFSESTLIRENVSHVELANAEILLKLTRQLAEDIQKN